jgi:fumarylacetoacetase
MELNYDLHFSIHNLPFGIFETPSTQPRVGVAYKNFVIDLAALAQFGVFGNYQKQIFENRYLNDFISQGKEYTENIRLLIQEILKNPEHQWASSLSKCLVQINDCTLLLPIKIGDYTDFYSSEVHANNVGAMFRDPKNPLLPNWKHLPVAYHGRASSIRTTGESFHRPKGQRKSGEEVVFGPSTRLDFELEMAAVIGKNSNMGQTIGVDHAEEYVFGYVMFNDWSARDIQAWEYVPLGPFLGKNFFSSISPWVVTAAALEPFKTPNVAQEPKVLDYLAGKDLFQYDIPLTVSLKNNEAKEYVLTKSNYKSMYWTVNQQIAHHTIGGCPLNVGDLLASGTISSPEGYGSMLELSYPDPITWSDGFQRSFIEDGDTVIFEGLAQKGEISVGFGLLENKVLPAI